MALRKKKEEEPETTLARCIVLLDDVRAYRRKDPQQIDAQFEPLRKSRFKDIYDMWVKARPAAEKIADMPLKIPGAKETIGRLAWLKVANRVFLIILIFLVAIQIVPIWRETIGTEFLRGPGLVLAAAFVILVVLTMNLATYWDYRLRKKIVAYEDSTLDEYAPSRDKMKECVDKMMRSLAREVGRTKKDPNYYGLVLYFDDYDNIEVKDKWKPKSMLFFKKSYNHFQVVPKP